MELSSRLLVRLDEGRSGYNSFGGYRLRHPLTGIYRGSMAIDAARNLRVRFAGFEHGEVRDGRLYVDTLLIFKNRRSYDVEIDGGSCSVSLDWGFGYRLLAPLEKRNRADTSAKNGA